MSAPVVRTPADVADLRLWLAGQWAPGRPFHHAAAPLHVHAGGDQDPDVYAAAERRMLQGATLWWVAEDMVDLLLASAAGVPADLAHADLPPMPHHGLVVFAKPWLGLDANQPGHAVSVDAMLWGRTRLPARPRHGRPEPCDAITVSSYRSLDFDQGLAPDELQLALGAGCQMHGTLHPIETATPELREAAQAMLDRPGGPRLGTVGTQPGDRAHGTVAHIDATQQYRMTGQTWAPLGRSDWPLGDHVTAPPWTGMADTTVASMVEDRKVVAALWTLLHQRGITATETTRPAKPSVRRTQRAGLARELADVQVVRLRKVERTEAEPGDGDHAKREYTHRWLVAGHWRWQPVGVGRAQRRLTYVRPHVKGPDDKPLHVPTRVNALVR